MFSGDTIQSRLIIAVISMFVSFAVVFFLTTAVLSLIPTGTKSVSNPDPEVVLPQTGELDIESAISKAILEHNKDSYLKGQYQAEGHVTLEIVEEGSQSIAYCIASYGEYNLTNNELTNISGSGPIPTKITFQKTESGTYKLLKYEQPLDGELMLESIRGMFPEHLLPKVENANDYYDALNAKKEEAAKKYFNLK